MKTKGVYPDLQVRIHRVFEDIRRLYRMDMRITHGFRTFKEQQDLFDQGRTKPGKQVTNAPQGMSWHCYGLAVDCCFRGADPYLDRPDFAKNMEWLQFVPKDKTPGEFLWSEFGKFGRAHGLTWGGDFRAFKDLPHLEIRYGLTLAECLKLHETGGLVAVWMTVDKFRKVDPTRVEWKDCLPDGVTLDLDK